MSGCASSVPVRQALEKGKAIPPGTVRVIGRFAVDPMVEQGNIAVYAPRGSHEGVIKMSFAADADKPLDKDALIPFNPAESIDWSFTTTSFVRFRRGPGSRGSGR